MHSFSVAMDCGFDEAIDKVTAALAVEGFGVLTDIDIQATLKKKIGVDRKPYRILGACNPAIANKALEADPDIGLMLPCNIVVREDDDGKIVVAITDPEPLLGMTGSDTMHEVGQDALARLQRVHSALSKQ